MEGEETNEENHTERVPVLNKIFEGLVSDASELIRDLYWGVKNYLFFGLISIAFSARASSFTSFVGSASGSEQTLLHV
jgi:hypothetical protein